MSQGHRAAHIDFSRSEVYPSRMQNISSRKFNIFRPMSHTPQKIKRATLYNTFVSSLSSFFYPDSCSDILLPKTTPDVTLNMASLISTPTTSPKFYFFRLGDAHTGEPLRAASDAQTAANLPTAPKVLTLMKNGNAIQCCRVDAAAKESIEQLPPQLRCLRLGLSF